LREIAVFLENKRPPVLGGFCTGEVYQHSCRPERVIRMMAKAVVAAGKISAPGPGDRTRRHKSSSR
jgi:hypothetical protein